MSFRFRVRSVWQDRQRRFCVVTGILEDGVVLPPVTAKVVEYPGETIRIDSMALGGALPDQQVTFMVSHSNLEPRILEGCVLSDT